MIPKRTEEIYYFNKNKIAFKTVIIKVKILYESESLFRSFVIEKIICGKGKYVGREDRIKEGKVISTNELFGTAIDGVNNYLFKEKPLIEKIFE